MPEQALRRHQGGRRGRRGLADHRWRQRPGGGCCAGAAHAVLLANAPAAGVSVNTHSDYKEYRKVASYVQYHQRQRGLFRALRDASKFESGRTRESSLSNQVQVQAIGGSMPRCTVQILRTKLLPHGSVLISCAPLALPSMRPCCAQHGAPACAAAGQPQHWPALPRPAPLQAHSCTQSAPGGAAAAPG